MGSPSSSTRLGHLILAILGTLLLVSAVLGEFKSAINSKGVVQFSYDRSTISIPNSILDADAKNRNIHVHFNFTLEGARIKTTADAVRKKPVLSSESPSDVWLIALDDETDFELTATVEQGVEQYYFEWKTPSEQPSTREVCFQLGAQGKDYWFNTFQQRHQQWPMETKTAVYEYPLNSIQNNTDGEFQYVVEHLFVGTNGYAILLDKDSPLWYRIEPNHGSPLMCISAKRLQPYGKENSDDPDIAPIQFHIYAGSSIKQVYDVVAHRRKGTVAPDQIPQERRFNYPVWSIEPGRSKNFSTTADLTQAKVELFVDQLVHKHRYMHGVIQLGTWWTTDSPYLGFNVAASQFPNPAGMAAKFNKLDYSLELAITPYVSKLSADFVDTANKDFWVKRMSPTGTEPWIVHKAAIPETDHALVDFSSDAATHWFKEKLKKLKDSFGVNSFTFEPITLFDGAEGLTFSDNLIQRAPAAFSRSYIEIAKDFGLNTTVCEGHNTQDLPLFIRMAPRPSTWEGLQSLIPTALALSLGGYSFFLPEVVGGSTLGSAIPEELYIRWVQAVTFMPAMQFATPPWDISEKANDITRTFVEMHSSNRTLFVDAAHKRALDGTPIIRPMWYEDPTNRHLYTIHDQFMVGEKHLVAPVVQPGAEHRKVYLPKGSWRALHISGTFEGDKEHRVDAKLDQLPVFVRTSN